MLVFDDCIVPIAKESLDFPMQTTIVQTRGNGSATYTRSTADYVMDHEGLAVQVLADELREEGTRRVYNQLPSIDFLTGWFLQTGMSRTTGVTDPEGGTTAYTFTRTSTGTEFYITTPKTTAIGNKWVSQLWIRRRTGTGLIRFLNPSGAIGETVTITSSWQPIANTAVAALGVVAYFGLDIGTLNDAIDVWHPQFEDVTGKTNQLPSEFIDPGVNYGAGVNGVKHYSALNGNSVTSNVVTFATGAAIPDSLLKGILGESSSTNLCLQSNNLAVTWGITGVTVPATFTTFIDGTATLRLVLETVANIQHVISQSTLATTSGVFTESCYLKKYGTRRYIVIQSIANSVASRFFVMFDLDTGTVVSTWTRGGTTPTNTSYSIESLPNGIFRVTVSQTTNGVGTDYISVLISNSITPTLDAFGQPTYTGSTSEGVYVGGGQIEMSPFASTYNPTTTTTITRNASSLTLTNAENVIDTQGTILLKITPLFNAPLGTLAGYGEQWIIDFGVGKGLYVKNQLLSFTDGTNTAAVAFVPLRGITYNVAAKWSGAGMQVILNGVASSIDSFDGSINSTTNMTIGGKGSDSTFNWKGNIKKLKVFKKSLPNSRIINLQKTFLVDEPGTQLIDELGTILFYF